MRTIGAVYQHIHIPTLTCELLAFTRKGAQVREIEGKTSKIAYYHTIDFDREKGLWKLQSPNSN